MAPEQFQGKVSRESDQYALGCIAYELVTGQRPFSVPDPIAQALIALAIKHATQPPIPPSKIDPQVAPYVEKAILKALAKERKERHKDVAAFLSALRTPLSQPKSAKKQEALLKRRHTARVTQASRGQRSSSQTPPPIKRLLGRRVFLFASVLLTLLLVGGSVGTYKAVTGKWPAQNFFTRISLQDVVWSGTIFVAVGYDETKSDESAGAILASPDGRTWTVQENGISQRLYDIAWSGSLFVAVGEYSNTMRLASCANFQAKTSGKFSRSAASP